MVFRDAGCVFYVLFFGSTTDIFFQNSALNIFSQDQDRTNSLEKEIAMQDSQGNFFFSDFLVGMTGSFRLFLSCFLSC